MTNAMPVLTDEQREIHIDHCQKSLAAIDNNLEKFRKLDDAGTVITMLERERVVYATALAALEIALPILEQQEKGDDGWIEWKGGECPVQGNPAVEVRLMDGTVSSAWLAKGWVWEHGVLSPGADIIAYRVIEQQGGEE